MKYLVNVLWVCLQSRVKSKMYLLIALHNYPVHKTTQTYSTRKQMHRRIHQYKLLGGVIIIIFIMGSLKGLLILLT